jgi:hypothetical protein
MPTNESGADSEQRTPRNPVAARVHPSDAPAPICPDRAVVRNAIDQHRSANRAPVQFAGDPFAEVSP